MAVMRRVSRWAMVGVMAGGMAGVLPGCVSNKSQTAPPANAETLRMVRQSLASSDPSAIVGMVVAVLPNENYAAVSDVPLNDFKVGDVITFIDTNKNPLTNGTVRRITSDALNVEYAPPLPNGRAPKVGDLGVRFKQ